jgi:rare lipoprotein A
VRPSRAECARVAACGALALAVVGALVLGCATDAEARRAGRAGSPPGAGSAPLVASPARAASAARVVEEGRASYYGAKFVGRKTASGERYDPKKLTAAHKSLPLGTRIRVTRLSKGKPGPSVEVRVNDRCGCTHGRIVDLSLTAARHLGMLQVGVVPVKLEVLGR